jgi:hypothetical protein
MDGLVATAGGRSALVTDWEPPDGRRMLQLALATLWLLDAVLQFQPYMFTRAFGNQMIAGMAAGNPVGVAHGIVWAGHVIGHHPEASNTAFGLIQLAIALGIACRPTVKMALAASVAWALAVWWIGEGLGGVLTATESPLLGAPGAVILYGLLAILLWPTGDWSMSPLIAARSVGATVARTLWLVLWGSLAYFALLPANRAPDGLHDLFAQAAVGQPHWVAALDGDAARLVANRGLAFSVVLALLLGVIAVGPFLTTTLTRSTLVVAICLSAFVWVVGEGFGGIFSGSGTDPNSGPLLVLLALSYWPRPRAVVAPISTAALSITGG